MKQNILLLVAVLSCAAAIMFYINFEKRNLEIREDILVPIQSEGVSNIKLKAGVYLIYEKLNQTAINRTWDYEVDNQLDSINHIMIIPVQSSMTVGPSYQFSINGEDYNLVHRFELEKETDISITSSVDPNIQLIIQKPFKSFLMDTLKSIVLIFFSSILFVLSIGIFLSRRAKLKKEQAEVI